MESRIIDSPGFAWDLTLSGSYTRNNLDQLGAGVAPITLGFAQRHVRGYPLGGFWDRPILSFNDANGNNIIEPGEYVIGDRS